MSRTVIFEVVSTIGYCHVEIADDTIRHEDLEAEARERIEDSGVDEPSRGIRFFENDGVEENEYIFKQIEKQCLTFASHMI